jgi:hypothetical protein
MVGWRTDYGERRDARAVIREAENVSLSRKVIGN